MTATDDPLYRTAIERFDELYAQAWHSEPGEKTAMFLATADADGRPSVRTVLLKQHDHDGFVFYTNHHSRKGRELQANPRAALLFLWQSLSRQVRIEGRTEVVTDAEADAYWATRPRASQLGAWASNQSETLASREEYEQRLAEYEHRFADVEVPRPPHWSGFRVVPDYIEFWHERKYRQHDRELCWFDGSRWQWSLLNP
ncbi:MAG: pyridoxamine 5'-phosphate oxidase [Halofilum sp. (in: g-proteobacteria)]|nr:pyridoxamine 5'-phosphate oxidase [Halofilum sp. (in: g-proteobacteria)]